METFTDITSIPISLQQEGDEPPLSPATKGLFFSIIHNTLTNVLRHSQATEVSVELAFGQEGTDLTISDNGVGLPGDYSERGEGFLSMLDSAEQMGGRIEVSSGQQGQGTTVRCWVPNVIDQGGRQVV